MKKHQDKGQRQRTEHKEKETRDEAEISHSLHQCSSKLYRQMLKCKNTLQANKKQEKDIFYCNSK